MHTLIVYAAEFAAVYAPFELVVIALRR